MFARGASGRTDTSPCLWSAQPPPSAQATMQLEVVAQSHRGRAVDGQSGRHSRVRAPRTPRCDPPRKQDTEWIAAPAHGAPTGPVSRTPQWSSCEAGVLPAGGGVKPVMGRPHCSQAPERALGYHLIARARSQLPPRRRAQGRAFGRSSRRSSSAPGVPATRGCRLHRGHLPEGCGLCRRRVKTDPAATLGF